MWEGFAFPIDFIAPGSLGWHYSRIYYSMLFNILNEIETDVGGLNLALNGTQATVLVRKGPKHQPSVDPSLSVQISKAPQPEEQKYLAFGSCTIWYYIEIWINSPNQRDWETNLGTYTQWREQIRLLFLPPLLANTNLFNLAGVWDVRVMPDDFLDREEMANMYDNQSIILKVGATT